MAFLFYIPQTLANTSDNMVYSLGVFRFSFHFTSRLASRKKIENKKKEIETYAVYQRRAILSRDALEATLRPQMK